MTAVELNRVTKTFGTKTAVDDLTLAVPTGTIYGFIGPNGSGKTTTLRMIMRIIAPDRGEISVLGDATGAHGAANDAIGYLPEERGLYKQMKVRDVLRFYAELKGHRPAAGEIEGWLKRVDLPGVADKKVETLSKGMSQKVQVVATVIGKPKLIILDEPFSGLDPKNAVVLVDLVLDLKKQGNTIIFSTHDMSTAERMCDFIFMINEGKKVLDGTLESIQTKYGTDVIHVRMDASNEGVQPSLDNLTGVLKVTDFGKLQELRTSPKLDRHQLLAELMQRGNIAQFEVAKPSLQDIFMRIASPDQLKGETVLA